MVENKNIISIIVASDINGGIGKDGKLCWKLKGDMEFFKRITSKTIDMTKKNALIMGRKTWESIPMRFRPLVGRLNIIITKNKNYNVIYKDVLIFNSLQKSIDNIKFLHDIENIYVTGGAQIYNESIMLGVCDKIYWTCINKSFECDTFIDITKFNNFYKLTDNEIEEELDGITTTHKIENGVSYEFLVLKKNE